MKKAVILSSVLAIVLLFVASCKKEECSECHYDSDNGEVELGEKCGTEIETLEKDGYTTGGKTYTVHCGEGH